MGNTTPWLSLAIWIPIAFGGLILAAGRDRNAGVIRTRRARRAACSACS